MRSRRVPPVSRPAVVRVSRPALLTPAIHLLLLLLSLAVITAQRLPASPNGSPHPAPHPAMLGKSVLALTGPWKFHTSDDPRWADPELDDSNWESYDLAPGNLDPIQALQLPPLPGWQNHGHPQHTGYAWYRIRLNLGSDSVPIALLMPQHAEDAYEVYVNGQLIGRNGKLDGPHLAYQQQPQLFLIPGADLKIHEPATLAIRFWSMPWEASPGGKNLYGGLRGVPLIGPSAPLQIFKQSVPVQNPGWSLSTAFWGYEMQPALYIGIGLISIFLFPLSRGREYLWAGIALIGRGILIAAIFMEATSRISQQLGEVSQQAALLVSVLTMPLAAMWLLSVPRSKWKWANAAVFALFCFQSLISLDMFVTGWPPTNAALQPAYTLLGWIPRTALGLFLLLVTIDGIRTIGQKAWVLLTPGILYAGHMVLYIFYGNLSYGLLILDQILSAGVPVSVLIIFLIRFMEQQRDNGRLVEDIRQAQEVQRLLIPHQTPEVPGWRIESEYHPAREVGGDFFQLLPGHDGSLLIVVGDVSGKGLQAAMTVSAIVGALRDSEERKPTQVLAHLNRVLCGQVAGFVTCCAALIAADGELTIANAGHLLPYRNGDELPAPSGLPLGILPEASYEHTRFHLIPEDRLTFVSDGVVEARNRTGELYGFARTRQISTQPAEAIARAAQQFGQEDDITVLTLTFVPAEVLHA